MTKFCTRCGQEQPIDQFARARANKDGRAGQCRSCRTELQRQRRASDPAFAERQRETVRRRRAAGRRAPSERLTPRAVRSADQVAVARVRRLYGLRVSAARVQAARFGAEVNDLTLSDWYAVVRDHSGRCAYCRGDADLWIEHVVPFAKGGNNTKGNVVPACESCNRKKARRSAEQFREGLCEAGHPRTGENVYTYPDGKKTACKPCRRQAQARSRSRKKEAPQ